MAEYLPIIIIGAVIGGFTLAFVIAYLTIRNNRTMVTFDRNMPDWEIAKRLLQYAKPYWKDFIGVFIIMLLSIGHNILSPLLVGRIEEIVKGRFALSQLFTLVAFYGGILVVSLVCTYLQAILLQIDRLKNTRKIFGI